MTNGTSVSREVAEQEFERMLKAARVKWRMYEIKHGKRDVEIDREIIIDGIMDGVVTINDDGMPTVFTQHENDRLKEVTFKRRPIKADRLVADRVAAGHDAKKIDVMLARLLDLSPAEVASFEEADAGLIESIWCVFLG